MCGKKKGEFAEWCSRLEIKGLNDFTVSSAKVEAWTESRLTLHCKYYQIIRLFENMVALDGLIHRIWLKS